MNQLFDDDTAKVNPMGGDRKYSRAVRVPQYEPSTDKPDIHSLYNVEKYNRLVARIKKSSVSEEEKKFLLFAASRHIVFTYSRIADYYANSEKEMQELMEESALVILDMDDAIANGYVALSEKMQQLIDEEKERDAKAREADKIMREQMALAEQKEREAKEAKKVANKKKKKKEEELENFMAEPEVDDEQND